MSGEPCRATVWIDGWQMACCGTPFSVGDSVDWSVRQDVDRPFLSDATSPETAIGIEYREEHHDDADEPARRARGRVVGIRAASCRYAFRDDEGVSAPEGGSGTLVEVRGTGERPPMDPDARHLGWIVELEQFELR